MFRNRNQCRFTAALEIRRLSFFPGRLLTWYCLHGHCANSKVSLISGRGGNTWPLCGHALNPMPSPLIMTEELKKYLVEHCRKWMLPEEIRALTRIGLTEHGEEVTRKSALVNDKLEAIYGFNDEKTNQLVELGNDKMEMVIAERLLKESGEIVINNCPKCGRLARTPSAKQCRYCGHDWHLV